MEGGCFTTKFCSGVLKVISPEVGPTSVFDTAKSKIGEALFPKMFESELGDAGIVGMNEGNRTVGVIT